MFITLVNKLIYVGIITLFQDFVFELH